MVSAIFLAAGQSKRLIKENKLTKIFKKKPLINHSLNSLVKSKVSNIYVVLGHEKNNVKKILINSKKISFIFNKNFKKGISTSIKCGLSKISKKNKGFIIVQSDMPFIKTNHINRICSSIKKKNHLIHALRFKNRVGNPIGFDISVLSKFRKIKGEYGAKFMVKKLKKKTNFIKVSSDKIFKDFDLKKDFN
jgi:molybdenum cofactor cytidylyltransferase|tara:strand:+ start:438 stop:1010 length:573 start_codon:yes stop_codon:yes gene_type:complete